MRFTEVTLAGPAELADFYGEVLELPVDCDAIRVGETTLRFVPGAGEPFYHFAFLVPGDRFDAALAWAEQRVELIGLQLWDGTLDEPDRLAFVGEKGRTLILAPVGRGWMPTGRPAEAHPIEYSVAI